MLLLRAAVSLSYFLPFIGGIAIVIRIFLSSSLHASFADFVKPHATLSVTVPSFSLAATYE